MKIKTLPLLTLAISSTAAANPEMEDAFKPDTNLVSSQSYYKLKAKCLIPTIVDQSRQANLQIEDHNNYGLLLDTSLNYAAVTVRMYRRYNDDLGKGVIEVSDEFLTGIEKEYDDRKKARDKKTFGNFYAEASHQEVCASLSYLEKN